MQNYEINDKQELPREWISIQSNGETDTKIISQPMCK